MSVPASAPPSTSSSASASAVSVPGLSALPSASDVFVPVPWSSALLLSTLPSLTGVSVPLPGLLALPSVSSVSGVSVPVPRSSAPPSVSGMPVPKLVLSPPPFSTWSDLQTPMSILQRKRLSQ